LRNDFNKAKSSVLGLLIAAAAGLASIPPAWAGRPLVTEDAGVLGQRECELESFAARSHKPHLTAQWAQFGCGVGFQTQLALGMGNEKSQDERFTATALSGKTFLQALTSEQAGVTLAYAVSGARQAPAGFEHVGTELKGVISVPHNSWLFHANLGWRRSHQDAQSRSIFALAVERPGAAGPIDLMAEIFGDDREAPWVQVAARWVVVPGRFFIDGSWGVQSNSMRSRQATIGAKIAF
jgi:hypothetical protein